MPATRRPMKRTRATPAPRAVVLELDPLELLGWARSIARGVRGDYHFLAGSQDEAELEGVAYLAIVELAVRFDEARLPATGDLAGAFRGWAAVEIRSRLRRAAVQLRNAGTFRTTADKTARGMCVEGLPRVRDGDGGASEVALAAPEPDDPDDDPDDDPEPVTTKYEPVVVIWNSRRSQGS